MNATFGRIAIAAFLIAAPLGVASAADMPVKAPAPPPPPAFDWNGFYIGAYAGAAWMDQATTNDPCLVTLTAFCLATGVGTFNGVPPSTYDMSPSFVGGGTVGFNWQPTPFTLLGLENEIGYIHLRGSTIMAPPPIGNGSTTASTKIGDWYDAYTVRVGATDGHAMLYLKGGGVSARYTTGVLRTNGDINTTATKTLTGWAAGGGVEYGIDMHWSVRAEYLVLGLPANNNTCAPLAAPPFAPGQIECTTTHTPNVQTITLGLNYRFR